MTNYNHGKAFFTIKDMLFEYDEEKNRANIRKHGISFQIAARVFFDYNRIEMYDEKHSDEEERFNTIGLVEEKSKDIVVGTIDSYGSVVFVVYTERTEKLQDGRSTEVTRIVSARLANDFERGLYYGKYYG